MHKLEWTEDIYRITGDYLGVITNYGADRRTFGGATTNGGWLAKILLPLNEDKPTHSVGMLPTARDAADDVCNKLGVDPAKAELVLAKITCRGIGEFTGEVSEEGKRGVYTATCAPSITMPSVTLVTGVSLDAAKAAVSDAFVLYAEAMGAVLEAASEVEKAHSGRILSNGSVELIIRAASDVGFRLSPDTAETPTPGARP